MIYKTYRFSLWSHNEWRHFKHSYHSNDVPIDLNIHKIRTLFMKSITLVTVTLVSISVLLMSTIVPIQSTLAHQTRLYTIGEKDYFFEVGSLNEPAFVDDKSGVALAAWLPDPSDPENFDANNTQPVEGLALKVNVSAGAKNITLDLEPAFGEPGTYEAVFYPTVATTYSYTIYGDINGTVYQDTFNCRPAGESQPAQDNSTVNVSEGVTRKGQSGGFSCFESRSDISFPEQYVSNYELQQMINSNGGASNSTTSAP
jgi:hypothetical protein